MNLHTFRRFLVNEYLGHGITITIDRRHGHFHKLAHVLRAKVGDEMRVFNGRDGEWHGVMSSISKEQLVIAVGERVRGVDESPPLVLLCAPPKGARWHHVIEQATQAGCDVIQPVVSHHSARRSINHASSIAVAMAATEQCGLLSCPTIKPLCSFAQAIDTWSSRVRLFFCHPYDASRPTPHLWHHCQQGDVSGTGVIIGSEGGWSDEECHWVARHPSASTIEQVHLGQNFYRVDSAAFLALSLLQLARMTHHERR